jgi:hypothetical protein
MWLVGVTGSNPWPLPGEAGDLLLCGVSKALTCIAVSIACLAGGRFGSNDETQAERRSGPTPSSGTPKVSPLPGRRNRIGKGPSSGLGAARQPPARPSSLTSRPTYAVGDPKEVR